MSNKQVDTADICHTQVVRNSLKKMLVRYSKESNYKYSRSGSPISISEAVNLIMPYALYQTVEYLKFVFGSKTYSFVVFDIDQKMLTYSVDKSKLDDNDQISILLCFSYVVFTKYFVPQFLKKNNFSLDHLHNMNSLIAQSTADQV